MPVITFTALSSLAAGMIAGQEYSIGVKRNEYEQEIEVARKQARSLSGKTVTTVMRRDRTWQISISAEGADTDKLFCMLDSMLAGASCTFDRDATIDTSGIVTTSRPVICELIDDSFKPKRLGMRSDAFQFTFKLREIGQPVYSENYYFDLDFTKGVNPDPNYFTYTRTGDMWAMRDDGKYYKYAANEMPSHYDMINNAGLGAWFGNQTTNSILYSSDFSNAVWVASSATKSAANSIFATEGIAQKIENTAANGQATQTIGVFGTSPDCLFAILEQGNNSTGYIGIYDATAAAFVYQAIVDYATGAVTPTVGTGTNGTARAIKLLGIGPNGGPVWLLAITVTPPTSGNSRRIYLKPQGNSAPIGQNGYLHHAQLQANAAVGVITPPIVTTAASVTRGADSFVCDNIPSWINNWELSVGIHETRPDKYQYAASQYALSIVNTVSSPVDYIRFYTSSISDISTSSVLNNSTQAGQSFGVFDGARTKSKRAMRNKQGDWRFTFDADAGSSTDTVGTIQTSGIARISIGCAWSLGSQSNSYIARALISPRTWTNEELKAWTV